MDGFRRNDYIAAIRGEYTMTDIDISARSKEIDEINEQLKSLPLFKLMGFKKTLRRERSAIRKEIKFFKEKKKRYKKLLYLASKYVPGKGDLP